VYCYLDGMIGYYEDMFRKGQLIPQITLEQLTTSLKSYFVDSPYNNQLKPKAARILQLISEIPRDKSYGDSMRDLVSATNYERLIVDALVDELITHQFVETKASLSPGKNHPKLLLRDFPLRMLLQIRKDSSENAIKSLAGFLFEDIVYLSWKEKLGSDWEKLHGTWDEPCTEIDSILVWKTKKVVIWGCLKLDPAAHMPVKHLCHVVSYFNNRNFQKNEYYSYKHFLCFVSPEFHSQDRQHLTGVSKLHELNDLLHGATNNLENACQHLLSNLWGSGKPFKFNARDLPSPADFFSVTACITLDTNDLESIDLEAFLSSTFAI